jgi:hypothetical protein
MPLKRSGIRDQVCDFNLAGIASQASEMGQISAKPDKANVGNWLIFYFDCRSLQFFKLTTKARARKELRQNATSQLGLI